MPIFLSAPLYCQAPPSVPIVRQGTTPGLSALSSDARLQNKITASAKGVALHDLLKQWREEYQISLTADRHTDGQKLQFRLRERPLGEVLTGIAELLQGEWKPEGKGYRLVRTPEAVAYAKEWWKHYEHERERARQSAVRQVVQQMNRRKTTADDLSRLESLGDDGVINGFHSTRFWADLPAAIQQEIAASYQNRGDMRLPPLRRNRAGANFHNVTSVSSDDGVIPFRFADLSPTSQESLRHNLGMTQQSSYNDQAIQAVLVSVGGSLSRVVAVLNDGRQIETSLSLFRDRQTVPLSLSLDHSTLAAEIAARAETPSKDAAALIAYQEQTVWKNDGLPKASDEPLLPRLPDVLTHYAEETGTDYLADYYSLPYRPLTETEWKIKIPDADAALKSLAANYDVSFRKSRNVTLIRHNRWYRNDVLEAPSDLKERLTKASAFPPPVPDVLDKQTARVYLDLELAALIAQEATEYQAANSLYYGVEEERMPPPDQQTPQALRKSDCQPLLRAADNAFRHYTALRFYAALSREERIAILSSGIPIRALSPPQYEQLSRICPLLPEKGLLRMSCLNTSIVPVSKGSDGRQTMGYPFQFGTSLFIGSLMPRFRVTPEP